MIQFRESDSRIVETSGILGDFYIPLYEYHTHPDLARALNLFRVHRPGTVSLVKCPAFSHCEVLMEVGIVGLPNVGKSTIFNALTNAGLLAANYPFADIDPNVKKKSPTRPRKNPRFDSHGKTCPRASTCRRHRGHCARRIQRRGPRQPNSSATSGKLMRSCTSCSLL